MNLILGEQLINGNKLLWKGNKCIYLELHLVDRITYIDSSEIYDRPEMKYVQENSASFDLTIWIPELLCDFENRAGREKFFIIP